MKTILFFTCCLISTCPIFSQSAISQDSLSERQLFGRIVKAYGEWRNSEQKQEDDKRYLELLEREWEEVKPSDLSQTKVRSLLSLYFYHFQIAENYTKAFPYFDTLLLNISNINPCSELYSVSILTYGSVLEKKGNFNESIRYYLQALGEIENCQSSWKARIPFLNNLANAYAKLGDYDKAMQYHQENYKNKLKAGESKLKLVRSLASLAYAQMQAGQLDAAANTAQAIIDQLSGKIGDKERRYLIRALLYLVDIYLQKNEVERAEEFLSQVETIQANFDYYRFRSYRFRAALSAHRRELPKAIQYIEKSITEIENNSASRAFDANLPEYYLLAGDLHQASGHLPIAKTYFTKALQILYHNEDSIDFDQALSPDSFSSPFYLVQTLSKYTDWLCLQTDYLESEKHSQQLLIAYDKLFTATDALIFSVPSKSAKLFHAQAIHELYRKGIARALACYEAHNNQQYLIKAFEFAEKSRNSILLQEIYTQHFSNTSSFPDSLFQRQSLLLNELGHNRALLKKARLAKDSLRSDWLSKAITEEEIQLDILNEAIGAFNPAYLAITNFEAPTIDDLRAIAKREQKVFIEYFMGEKLLHVFRIDQHGLSHYSMQKGEELEALIKQLLSFFNSTKELSPATFSLLANDLYHRLFPFPISEKEDIILIPDGALYAFPFDVLTTKADSQATSFKTLPYLLREVTISYQYSLRQLVEQTPSLQAQKCLLAVAPHYKGDEALPYNEEEITAIAEYYPADQLRGAAASEQAFKKRAWQYQLIHLAGHGIMDGQDPDNSHIMFSDVEGAEDAALYPYEIRGLRLRAELVVLSACETGNGKLFEGEGMYSLARNFIIAGATSTVNSLWKMEDVASRSMMRYFYENLKEGQTNAESLRNAKLHYLQQSDNISSHPNIWGGYVLVGQTGGITTASPLNRYWMVGIVLLIVLVVFFRRRLLG